LLFDGRHPNDEFQSLQLISASIEKKDGVRAGERISFIILSFLWYYDNESQVIDNHRCHDNNWEYSRWSRTTDRISARTTLRTALR